MAALPAASSTGERTKVVVRNLPPGLTAEKFLAILGTKLGWQPDSGAWTWLSYYQGKVSVKRTVFSRAYLNMASPLFVLELKAKLDGHTFVSTRGTQYRCSVEYAPFQKIPQQAKKRNPLEGTIDQDPDYQAFLKELEEGPALLPSAAAQREQQEKQGTPPDAAPPTNPLLEYLKARHQANPGMRLGGMRRNKPKAAADSPEPILARDKGKAKEGRSTGVGSKEDKGRSGQRGKGAGAENGAVVAAASNAAAMAVAAAMGGGTVRQATPSGNHKGASQGNAGGSKGPQQACPKSAAHQAAAQVQQQQQQRPASAAPKVLLGRGGVGTPQKDATAQGHKAQEVQGSKKQGQQQHQGAATDTKKGPANKPAPAQPAGKAAAAPQVAAGSHKETQPSSSGAKPGSIQKAAAPGENPSSARGGAEPGPGISQAPSKQAEEAGTSGDGASKRRVRAGFAAYRPPVRPSAGDGG